MCRMGIIISIYWWGVKELKRWSNMSKHRWKWRSRFSRPALEIVAEKAIWMLLKYTEFLQFLWSHSPVLSAWPLKPLSFQVCSDEREFREETGARPPSLAAIAGWWWPQLRDIVWFPWVCPLCLHPTLSSRDNILVIKRHLKWIKDTIPIH